MRFATFCLQASLAILLFPSCDSKPGHEESRAPSGDTEDPSKSTQPQAAELAQISLEAIGMVDPNLHRESPKDEWQGEVFNDEALSQLKAIGDLLEDPTGISNETLTGIIVPKTRTQALVPENLEEIFADESYSVRRAAATNDSPQDILPLSFTDALTQLLEPFDSTKELHSKFKIFGVSLDENGQTLCEVYFQLTGSSRDGNGQSITRKARWHCRWHWPDADQAPLLKEVQISEFEETRGSHGFIDCSESVFAGVDSYQEQFLRGTEHWAGRIESRYGIGISGWHGMALGDANGDGLDDLYLCEPGGLPNRLFLANPDGTVRDASQESGTNFRLQTQSALFVDLDNDGDQDLVIATTLGVLFMENDDKGAFSVRGSKLVPEAPPVALAAADLDLDGDLDIYTACYSLRRINTGDPDDDAAQLGRPLPYHDANNAGRNVLFRNDRNWRFTDATVELGLDQNNRRYSFAPTWEDYDNDGDPDLYVANDYGRNNLYRNDRDADGNIHFTDVAAEAGVEDISAGMSATWGDADGDGDRDLYVSNMWSSAGNRIAYQRNFQTTLDDSVRGEFQRHARGNSLFLNNGDGTFSDASEESGVTMGRWAWGSRFADINNDSRQDIIVSNGFLTQADSGDL
ncbi:VCBS repeat-containing protein [Verrucomicrobiaceae bacterium 227]